MKKTELFAIIFGVVVLAIVVGIVMTRPPEQAAPAATVQNLPAYSLPEKFPISVPMESGAKIVGNYNATSADGKIQATRTFESEKSVDDNFALYKSYVMDRQNGWTYLNEVNDPANAGHKAIFASGANGILNINISAGSVSGTSVVDISFLASK